MVNENLITPAPVTNVVDPAAVTSAPVVVPAPEPAPAPVAVPAPEAPAAPVTVLGTALDAPVAAPAPAAVEPVKEPVAAPVTETKTESKAAEAAPKTKGGQSEVANATPDEPAPPPSYDPFKLPEGVTLDNERVGKFTGILSELETKAKVDHKTMQEFGQKAVDFHLEELKAAQQAVTDLYAKSWEKQKIDWKDQFLKDPEMGGNRFQTTVDSALSFIRTHGGTPEQQTEFRNLMETSGLGNHPAMIRLLANAGRAMSEGKPLSNVRPVPQAKSKVSTLYGNMGQ